MLESRRSHAAGHLGQLRQVHDIVFGLVGRHARHFAVPARDDHRDTDRGLVVIQDRSVDRSFARTLQDERWIPLSSGCKTPARRWSRLRWIDLGQRLRRSSAAREQEHEGGAPLHLLNVAPGTSRRAVLVMLVISGDPKGT